MVCIITLIFAAGIISPLNDIEEYADEHGGRLDVNPNIRNLDGSSGEDFDAGSSQAAAGFLIFVCCAGIVFHSVSIAVRVYYIRVGTRKYMCIYYVVVSKSTYMLNKNTLGVKKVRGQLEAALQIGATKNFDIS